MGLDDLIKEAEKAKLNPDEIEFMKRHYRTGFLRAYEIKPEPDFHKYGSAILGIIHQRTTAEYCGEAHARKYIRETIEARK